MCCGVLSVCVRQSCRLFVSDTLRLTGWLCNLLLAVPSCPSLTAAPPLIVFTQQALGAGRLVPFFRCFGGNHKVENLSRLNPKHVFSYYFFPLWGASRSRPHLWSPLWLAESPEASGRKGSGRFLFFCCNSKRDVTVREASLRRPLCQTPIQWPPRTHTHFFL